MTLIYVFDFILFVILSIFSYLLIKLFDDLRKNKYLNSFVDGFSKREEERQIQEQARYLLEGESSKLTFINKVDKTIERSMLKVLFPFLTSEMLIFFIIAFSLIAAIICYIVLHVFIASVAVLILSIIVITIAVQALAKTTFDKIDNEQLFYTKTLKNISESNEDIPSIFGKSISYIEEPLKTHTKQFVYELEKGIPLKKAFKNFEDKVENKRFKMLLKNLYIAAKHTSNYKAVLEESTDIVADYLLVKETRRMKVRHGRMGILLLVAMGIGSFKAFEGFVGNIYVLMINTPIGNAFLVYFILILSFALYKFITLEKLNY